MGVLCQSGSLSIFHKLKNVNGISSVDDLAVYMGDFNGHADRYFDGFDFVHGGYDVG